MSEPLEPKERKHFSISELRDFLSCPLRYWFRWRLGLWTDTTTSYFLRGNAVHAGLEKFYMGEALNGVRDPEGAMAMYHSTWAEQAAGVKWEEKDDPFVKAQTGAGLLRLSITTPDDWKAVGVERVLYGDVIHSRLGKLPFPLKSKGDMLVAGVDGDDKPDMVEHKTADKSWEKGKEAAEAQPTGYTITIRQNYGHDPSTTYNIMVANKVPLLDRGRIVRRTQDDIDRLYIALRNLLDMEERGGIYPNPTAFAHRHCEFRKICDTWEGHPQKVPSGVPLQLMVPGLSDYAARVPGARWGKT